MRDSFSNALVEAAERDPRVYLLTGDHGYALFDSIRKNCPEKYLNAGVAEQNMIGVAAGMAKAGMIPIVYGLAAFIPIRVLEQIKLDICFENLQVIMMGDGAGVVYSKLGVSHQCAEDIAAARTLPNLKVFSPCDKYEMDLCMNEALNTKGPSYIRMGKSDVGEVHENGNFAKKPGIHLVKKGSPNAPVIFATGSMVKSSMNIIEKEFKDFNLYSVSQIKPMTSESLLSAVGESSSIITIEEHNVLGGLGSAIAEIMSATHPKKILRLGIQDRFTDKCGTWEHLMLEHGLDEESLVRQIRERSI